jgi:hypothetical protein
VNGVDFWADGAKRARSSTYPSSTRLKTGVGVIRARNEWVGPDGVVQATDDTTIRIPRHRRCPLLDYEVTLKAPAGKPVVFGDTKEGSMAIRLPLWMTPPHSYNDEVVDDKARRKRNVCSTPAHDRQRRGREKHATWGKKSNWVDYHAPKDGKVYGIAMFDHPKNPRSRRGGTCATTRCSRRILSANTISKISRDQPKAGDLEIPPVRA